MIHLFMRFNIMHDEINTDDFHVFQQHDKVNFFLTGMINPIPSSLPTPAFARLKPLYKDRVGRIRLLLDFHRAVHAHTG